MTQSSDGGGDAQNNGPRHRIHRIDAERNFKRLPLYAVTDTNLSWKAKGLLWLCLSRPDDWTFYESEIMGHAPDGRDATRAALRELERAGYLKRERARRDDGTYGPQVWEFSEVPKRSWASDSLDIPPEREIRRGFTYDGKTYVGESDTTTKESVLREDGLPRENKPRSASPEKKKRPPPLASEEHRCPRCDWNVVHKTDESVICSDCIGKDLRAGHRPEREQQQRGSGSDDGSEAPPDLCRTQGCTNARAPNREVCHDCRPTPDNG